MLYVKIIIPEEDETPVSTLNKGSYVLGRGPMLKCFDKRVSRSHAKLIVGDQNVTLTSMHINPCFHRALGGRGITIIPKDQTKQLQDGDKFALLADQFWYEIKIDEVTENEDKSPQLTQNQACEPTNNQTVTTGNETIYVVNLNSSNDSCQNKLDKKEDDEDIVNNIQDDQENSKFEKPPDTSIGSPFKVPQEKQDIKNMAGPSKVTSDNSASIDASQSLLCSNVVNTSPVNSQPIVISSEEIRVNQKRNPSDDVNSSPTKRQKLSPQRHDPSKATDEIMEVDVTKNDDNKKENANISDSGDEDSQLDLCLVGSSEDKNPEEQVSEKIEEPSRQEEAENRIETSTNNPPEAEADNNSREEVSECAQAGNESRTEVSECAQNEDVGNRDGSPAKEPMEEDAGNKDEEQSSGYAQKENDNEDASSPAKDPDTNRDAQKDDTSDGTGAPDAAGPSTTTVRRDRCWYGTTCYRKDPTHKTHFSHRGDNDYDSDPKDDRPTCAYGAACYRKNLNHRQRYKHPGPPARNPNNTNAVTGRPRRRATGTRVNYNDNNTPDDDYDYSDPFIDDGSSDEYHLSDDSGSESDTEFTPSQDSEDLKALIKDAKKFTKR